MFRVIRYLILFIPEWLFAQTGGGQSFSMLSHQPNARIAAMGGSAIASFEKDIGLAIQNPALLRSSQSGQTSLSHAFYFADVQAGSVMYGYASDSNQAFAGSLQYVSYGNFEKTSANGEVLGSFTAGDYSLGVMYSKKLTSKLQLGTQLKFIYSSLESYTSTAIAVDAGITWHDPVSLWTYSLVLSNIGKQLKSYTPGNSEDIPLNLQAGISKKLKNAPFRFSAVANHLEKPGKLVYTNLSKPSLQKDLSTGETIPENIGIGTKIMSHLLISSELLLGKSLYLAFGYNYLRRWEMGLRDLAGTAGFSWGFGIRISKLQFSYARSAYMPSTSTDHLTLVLNLRDFGKKQH